jgi:hypothetical protein
MSATLWGDSGKDVDSISDVQKHVITCFVGYIVTLPTSQLSEIPSDHWDLAPDTSLTTSNNLIRVSYIDIPGQERHYVVEPSQSRSLVPWKLVVPDAATAMMCLRRDWGSDISNIALKLLQKGIALKTLQPMAVPPHARRPLSELRTYSLGYFRPPFKAVYADYVTYEQYRHEFMNEDRARAALLRGGILWRLALHSLGYDHLPNALFGLSRDAVPFGQMLTLNGETHFDDDLSEEEVDFICGTYYVYTSKLSCSH